MYVHIYVRFDTTLIGKKKKKKRKKKMTKEVVKNPVQPLPNPSRTWI